MKKWMALALAAAMTLSMAACGTETASSAVQESASEEVSSVAETENTVDESLEAESNVEEISKIVAETDAEPINEDYIAVEELSIEDYGSFYHQFIKIRNNYVENLDNIVICFQALDANGDIIGKCDAYFQNVDMGQGITEESQTTIGDGDITKVAAFKFISYEMRQIEDNTIVWSEKYDFVNPIVFVKNPDGTFGLEGETSETSEPEYSQEEIPEHMVGESISTDQVEFTLNSLSFCEKLDISTHVPIESGSGVVPSNDDMIYACISFSVNNIGKDDLEWRNFSQFTIDYNNGYLYSAMDDSSYSYLVKLDGTADVQFNKSSSYGTKIHLAPLSSDTYTIIVQCPKVMKEDTTSPIVIDVDIPSGSGFQTVKYVVQ